MKDLTDHWTIILAYYPRAYVYSDTYSTLSIQVMKPMIKSLASQRSRVYAGIWMALYVASPYKVNTGI